MKWLKRKGDSAPNSYWDTISDVMSNLMLILLLVIVLLVFYVVRAPEYKNQESNPESVIVDNGVEEQYVEREAGNTVAKVDVPYILPGEDDEAYGRGEQLNDYEYEDGGYEEGTFDGHAGAAIRIIAEDAETNKAILEEGITFSLYSSEGRLKRLYTYYPSRTGWIKYATDSSGSLTLPEKLPLAEYILHEVTAPAGYELSEDVPFTVEEPHTWKDPYIVHVPLTSVRDTVEITAVDNEDGHPVAGSVFDLIAAENIVTADGTVRYAKETVVEQIVCDEDGKGRSSALYLGEYVIRQSAAPDYYAVDRTSYPVTLGADRPDGEPIEQRVLCQKTRFRLHVADDLYQTMAVSDAQFAFTKEGETIPATYTTDAAGNLLIEMLDKDATYTLSQSSAPEGYRASEKDLSFHVDGNGWIEGKPVFEAKVTNRILRLSVMIHDRLFGNSVSDCRVSLYNEKNELYETWYSSDVNTTVQGMPAGKYHLEITGAGGLTQEILIEDVAEVQSIRCVIWTTGNKVMIGGSGLGVVGVGAAAGYLIKRKRKRK